MGELKYILFDCDNTLCKSEALAFEACADTVNRLLEDKGQSKRYTSKSLLQDFVGKNFSRMLDDLQPKFDFNVTPEEKEGYVKQELDAVIAKLKEHLVECPGVTEQLEILKKNKVPMAVVSTSAKPRVIASLEKCKMLKPEKEPGQNPDEPDERPGFFEDAHVYSAVSSLNPPSSKPDPAIYHHACKELGVKESECIAVEDSKTGAEAALAAGIPCIGYVGVYKIEEGKDKMDQMTKLLTEVGKCREIMTDWSEFPEILERVKKQL